MKDQVKAPVIVVVVVAVVALLFFFGSKAMSVGDLDQGQVKYTPGKPPWEDPLQKGKDGRTPAAETAAGGSTPRAPAGMAPPAVGSGRS